MSRLGTQLNLFVAKPGSNAINWAVLNCHDYSHVDLLLPLIEQSIELVVVVTYNVASRLYWQYAIADIHRLFCYVVIVNVAELGGSGVFAPFRRIGIEKNAEFGAGGQIFSARGPAKISATIDLDIVELRNLRTAFRTHGFEAQAQNKVGASRYTAIVPSEHYMTTFDRQAGPPPVRSIVDIETAWDYDKLRVAVAQLESMPVSAYISTKYRIRQHSDCAAFERLLTLRLETLEARCKHKGYASSGSLLDLLVFPEVFIPRPYAEHQLQAFSDRLHTTIICGVDYPDGGESENANECVVIRPSQKPIFYRKITRSQYDAHKDENETRMKLSRGDALYRFVNHQERGFGVLICYDFSHVDLISKLNRYRRRVPLDVMIVVAHNPFGELYRSCCLADSHRFYQFVVMCNVARFGGSGVFAPIRTSGTRQTVLEIGKGTDAIGIAELDLDGLHRARLTADTDLHERCFMRRPGIFQN